MSSESCGLDRRATWHCDPALVWAMSLGESCDSGNGEIHVLPLCPDTPPFFPSLSKRCFLMGARYKLGGGKGALVRGLHWVLCNPY